MPGDDDETNLMPALAAVDLRRVDIDAKQAQVAALLADCQSEGLLVLHPANFRWLTAGANPSGLYGRDEMPALFFNASQRWLLASATDSPRFFNEDLDGLGFQLKEWHWTASREQMLADLVYGRRAACDQPFRECKHVGVFLASERRMLSAYETARLTDLGQTVAHALEATARNLSPGETEAEIAGHIAHRLVRHGAEPIALQVSADGAGRSHRRRSYGSAAIHQWCTLQATARQFGLHATAARTVCFGPPEATVRAEYDAALRVGAAHLAVSRAGERVLAAYDAGKAVLRATPFEHEWRTAPPFCITGREPAEGIIHPAAQDHWVVGLAVVWQERIGAAAIVDTFVLGANGWQTVTPAIDWPIRRAVVFGREFDRPDILVRPNS